MEGAGSPDPYLRIDDRRRQGDIAGLIFELRDLSNPPSIRAMAVSALVHLDYPDKVGTLAASLDDPSEVVRRAVAVELGKLRAKSAIPALLSAVGDPDPTANLWILDSLAKLQAREAIPHIAKFLDSNKRWEKRWAAKALAAIGDPAALVPLMNASDRERIGRKRPFRKAIRRIRQAR